MMMIFQRLMAKDDDDFPTIVGKGFAMQVDVQNLSMLAPEQSCSLKYQHHRKPKTAQN